ncbi:Agmatine coumaroyltransferase-2 [Nymphaea thermarum]|nr:Agmatine coumaroyltransferase-2 [Nymphaea thermarum]
MDVKHHCCTLVKPAKSLRRKFRLNIFDKKASDLHIAVLFIYNKPGTSPNSQIMLGLSKALSYYPQLAGRLSDGHFVVDDDGCGVPVFETTVTGQLDDFLPLEPSPSLYDLHPHPEGSNPMLMVQLNRFDCGGLVIGLCASHKVADGQAMSNFFVSWSQLVRSPEMELDRRPILDSESLLVPRNPPVCSYPHERLEFSDSPPPAGETADVSDKIHNVVVNYPWEFVNELKKRASSTSPAGLQPSTFACLLSHVWRKVSIARGLRDDEVTSVRVLVNGRPRLGIAPEFFGNVVLDAYPKTTVEELVKEGVGYGARAIKEAVGKVDGDYFQSFIDFGEVNKEKELVPSQDIGDNFLSPNLEVDSWLGFRFHEVDMGAGAPYAFRPSWIPMEGLVIFVPAPSEKGGVDLIITLFKEHTETFKKIAHFID